MSAVPVPMARPPLATTAAETTPENPWPLRLLNSKITEYVARMSPLWVEGQLVQINRRPGQPLVFMTLRDADVDMSISLVIQARDLATSTAQVTDGARVVVRARPTFWPKRGTLQLQASEIRPVGLGELLARIEHLKRVLAAEGLFAADRKRPLPFLPRRVGLICGRESKAEHDVVVNAKGGVVPIGEALWSKGMPLGTVTSLMMGAIALSIPEAIMLRRVMKPPLLAMFFGSVTIGIIIVGYLFNLIYA